MAKTKSGLWGAALGALALASVAADAGVREGVEAWRAGDYARAIAEWQPLADAGDPDAQFNLGQAYKLGRGVEQDMGRAEELFASAAMQGHLQAEANYGLLLFQDGQREAAMPWLIRAAERGEPRAQYIYGTALFNGDYVERDWPRAYAMMSNASNAGVPQALASVQQMDQHIPLEQREQGLEIARQMAEYQPVNMAAADDPTSAPPTPSAPTPAPPPPAPAPVPPPPPPSPPASVPTPPPPAPSPAPTPVPAPTPAPAPAPAARTGDWRIQLGSFRDRSNAENLWNDLAARSGEIATLQPYLVRAGPYTRLQAGPFETQAQANAACTVARRAGSECIAVRRQ